MAKPNLEDLRAEFERQNHALADLAESIEGRSAVDVPPSFFEAFDDACEVRRSAHCSTFSFTFALRA